MKRLLLTLIAVSFVLSQVIAQESTFKKGDKVINLGVGLGSNFYQSSYYHSFIPPLSASIEVGVADEIIDKGVIGAGGYFGFSSSKYPDHWRESHAVLGARGNFHYPLVEKLDTYAGLLLGWDIVSYYDYDPIYADYSRSTSGVAWALFLGARYYFKENIAAMAELGYGVAYLNIGIAFKF